MIISGVKCDKCNRTETNKYETEHMIKILYTTKGWKITDKEILCPLCVMKENTE